MANWADEDANHLPSIPHGFGGVPGSPVRGGAFPSGLSPPGGGFSPPGGGLGGVPFHPPPGMPGFAPGRSPPNYSFGTGVPNAANDGIGPPGGGYPGAPGPGFSVGPGSPTGAGFRFGSGASPPASVPNGVPGNPIGSPPSPGRGYQEARPARPSMPVPSSPPFTAFVGNFPYECPREEVVGLFTANACAIADVRMVRNRDTDRPRGYFLEFEDKASLERALTFDRYDMGGRPLRVNVAEGKPERREGRFGGGGGFADRYNERDRRGGGFADRYNDATGLPKGGGGSFGRREGGAGYQEARGGGGGGGRGDKASFTGGGYHAPRGGGGGDRGRRSFDRDPDAAPPEGRKKLELKPRSADAAEKAAEAEKAAAGSSSKPNPFGSAKPVDTTAKIAEAERKIQEEKDRVNAKAGVAAKGEVPAPKPLSKSAVQPDAKRKPIVLAPEENAKIEATNVFALLNMDDDEDGDDTEADAKDGDGEEEAKEEP